MASPNESPRRIALHIDLIVAGIEGAFDGHGTNWSKADLDCLYEILVKVCADRESTKRTAHRAALNLFSKHNKVPNLNLKFLMTINFVNRNWNIDFISIIL